MSMNTAAKPWRMHSASTQALLIGAQLLALSVFVLALVFLRTTTGGTLFLFSTIAPILAMLAALSVLGVAIYRFLRRHSLFEIEEVKPGEVIFQQGDPGNCAYFVQEGVVEVVREENGTKRMLTRLSKGQYFGEMALISDAPRNATVRTITSVRVAVLGKDNFLMMLRLLPHTQEDIMETMNARAMKSAEK